MKHAIWTLSALGVWIAAGTAWAQQTVPPVTMQNATYVNPFAQAQGYVNTPQAAMASRMPRPSSALPTKPYSNYSPPPVLSPYMNLFRNDSDFGRVNNYYSLVKPQLDQRAYDQRMQNQIQLLQNQARTQAQELNRLNLQGNTVPTLKQGTVAPQTPLGAQGPVLPQGPVVPQNPLMNWQNYYPSVQDLQP